MWISSQFPKPQPPYYPFALFKTSLLIIAYSICIMRENTMKVFVMQKKERNFSKPDGYYYLVMLSVVFAISLPYQTVVFFSLSFLIMWK
jgi:hypothetical protein